MTEQVLSISCPECAGQLRISGARNVHTLTCMHCFSILDPHEHYKPLGKFLKVKRPKTPLKIGDKATYKGVSHQLIGIVQSVNTKRKSEKWIDHQLYSPTHGYAWLSLENGHFTISRKVRGHFSPALPPKYSPDDNQYVHYNESRYRVWDGYNSKIIFAEGELNWSGAVEEKTRTLEACAPPRFVEYEVGENEIEYYAGTYLTPLEVQTMFDLPARPPAGKGVFGAKPTTLQPATKAFSIAACIAFFLTLIAGIMLTPPDGEHIGTHKVNATIQPISIPFTVEANRPIIDARLRTASLSNEWVWYEIDIENAEGVPVFEIGRENGFYSGSDSDGRWTEERQASFQAILTPGDYTLNIALSESQHNLATSRVSIYLNACRYDWFFLNCLIVLYILAFLIPIFWNGIRRLSKWNSE